MWIFTIIFIVISFSAHAWSPFGPNNYDDCVLENIKEAQNPQAVHAVKQACRSKFPFTDAEICKELPNIKGLTFEEIRAHPNMKDSDLTDAEIIKQAQSIGMNTEKLIAQKRCKDYLKQVN